MSPTPQYHSVNNVDIEHGPDLQSETMPQHGSSNDKPDDSPDSGSGSDSNVTYDNSSSHLEGGGHPRELRLSPGLLNQEPMAIKFLSWTWEVVLTALPLFFFTISILALQLNEQVRSTVPYGPKIEEITRLSPTIYPILFAMIAARFYRNAARWHLERPGGVTVSSLEKIVGSSSFASAVERLFVIRTQLVLGLLILLTWAMSPLGGQSSSRLLRIDEKTSSTYEWIYYDVRHYQRSVFFDPDYYTYGPEDIIKALYSGSLLSPRKQHQAYMDLWGRPKIPQWHSDLKQDDEVETWRSVNRDALAAGSDYYTSLIGVNLQGLNLTINSTTKYEFNLESDYIDFNCSLVSLREEEDGLRKISYAQMLNRTAGNLAELVDRKSDAESFVPVLADPINPSASPYILYTSRGNLSDSLYYSVFNCTTDTIDLQTNLVCTAEGCSPQRQRRIRNAHPMAESDLYRRLVALENAVRYWPRITHIRVAYASATENYIANDENAYAEQKFQDWTDVDINIFSKRLTTAFNTIWEAGKDSYNITKSALALPDNPGEFWTNRTRATVTKTEEAYYVNRFWVVVLMLTTAILQVLAVGGLVLRYLIRGPDILGYASSLTRDNQFASISGGSYLDGAERARSLRDVRVQLADVKPDDSCGYIALSVVPFSASAGGDGEGGKGEDQALGPMERKRMYA